jgi:spermidine/putrescine transport system substrate-binding protein
MLCWEGYDADPITALFKRKFDLQLQAETLLSDAAIADELLAGRHPDCDILNINNAYIRDCLEPASLVAALDSELNELYRDTIHSLYQRFLPWSYNASGDLIGIGQRYGPFNLVINTDAISRASAEDQGFGLADDPAFRNRYAILDYPDFNLFHVCIGAGINTKPCAAGRRHRLLHQWRHLYGFTGTTCRTQQSARSDSIQRPN